MSRPNEMGLVDESGDASGCYERMLKRVVEWPSPWWFVGLMALVLGPCIAFAVGLSQLFDGRPF